MPERRTRIVMFTQLAQEVAKATKSGGFETRPYIFLRPLHLRLNFSCFVRCALLCLKIFAACANSTDGLCPLVTRLGLCSRQGAKNAKSGFIFFLCGLCAFARNILAFDCGDLGLRQCARFPVRNGNRLSGSPQPRGEPLVDRNGNAIPGLYCGGESAGGFSMHGLARCDVQGRIAGKNAATEAPARKNIASLGVSIRILLSP